MSIFNEEIFVRGFQNKIISLGTQIEYVTQADDTSLFGQVRIVSSNLAGFAFIPQINTLSFDFDVPYGTDDVYLQGRVKIPERFDLFGHMHIMQTTFEGLASKFDAYSSYDIEGTVKVPERFDLFAVFEVKVSSEFF